MAVDVSEREYRAVIRMRTRKARGTRTQAQMAQLLNVETEIYKKWENRGVIPHHKLALFCLATQIDLDDLVGQPTKAELEEIRLAAPKKGKPAKAA